MPTRPPSSEADKVAAGKPIEDEAARLALAQADMPAPPDLDDLDDDDDDEDLVAYTASEAAGAFATVWRFTWPHLRNYKSWVAIVGLGLFVETLFNVIMPLSLKYLIDDALGEEDFQALYTILSVLAVAGIITSIVAVWYERWDARLAASVIAVVRERLFNHVQNLPAAYFGRTKRGEILSRFSVDVGG
jgi:ATP-binding cassette subfamily B protein